VEIECSDRELLLHPCPDFAMNPEPDSKPPERRSRVKFLGIPLFHFSDDPAAHGEIVFRFPKTLLTVRDDLFWGRLHGYPFFRRSSKMSHDRGWREPCCSEHGS
jgi:hypothetical protein